jgi:hypothetical protein
VVCIVVIMGVTALSEFLRTAITSVR